MGYPYYPYPASRAAEVFQVDNEQAVSIFPVNYGSTVLMLDRGDQFIAVKSVAIDGTATVTFYDKRPPAPAAPSFDPAAYVTRDEIQALVASALASQGKKKKEAEE